MLSNVGTASVAHTKLLPGLNRKNLPLDVNLFVLPRFDRTPAENSSSEGKGVAKTKGFSNLFSLKGECTFCRTKTQCPQIYTKLTQFEDNDSRKLP